MKKILPYRVSKKAAGIKKRKDIRDITPSNVEETKDIRRVSSFRGKVTKASNKCEKRIMCVAEHTLVGPGHVYSYNWRPIGHVCGCTSSTISIHTRHILRNHLGGGKITYKPSVKAWCDSMSHSLFLCFTSPFCSSRSIMHAMHYIFTNWLKLI